jgi:uncharacterized protein
LVQHSIQTNAGLITPEWCDFLAEFKFAVGVSVDGPEWANSSRRDRAGRDVYGRIMRGIRMLRYHRVPITAIAVVTTETIRERIRH